MAGQLERTEFAENPEPRCAVALILDVSGSMAGRPIEELNAGLHNFHAALKKDSLAALRVEVALITFGGEVQTTEFVTLDKFNLPTLTARGETPLGQAVQHGLSMLRERKDIYKYNGVDYFRPWLFLISDGAPTDEWEAAAAQARQEEARKGVLIHAVGAGKADFKILARFCSPERPPVKLKGLDFLGMFQWLSKSLSVISQSHPGSQAPLPPVQWGEVQR